MLELALEQSDWLMVDSWESHQESFQRTAVVLDHFHKQLNDYVEAGGTKRKIKIVLLAGGDLIESFQVPGLWDTDDLHHILGHYGCLVLERTGSE